MKRRIKIVIEYDGSNYSGWQKQPNADTVQQKIEDALGIIFKQDVAIYGAGRTDAGVCAFGQVAHFDIENSIPAEKLKLAINTKLPNDIRIIDSYEVGSNFHARYSAKGKHYRYTILNRAIASAVYRNTTCHVKYDLNIDKMKDATKYFLGEHDFTAFCSAGCDVKDKVRCIKSLTINEENDFIHIDIIGNGFLYNMVRIIAGTLIDVGLLKKEPEVIKEIINSKDRERAGITSSASGLCLIEVFYNNFM